MPIINLVYEAPDTVVQTFDFQNDWELNWTGYSIGYGTPSYVTWQGWRIWTSSSSSYQWWIIPPSSIYWGTLKKYKIWFYKPSTTTSSRWAAIAISDRTEANAIEYWRFSSTGWLIIISISGTPTNISSADLTGECTMEIIFEDNWHITVNLADTSNTYTYDLWNYASNFQTYRNNSDLWMHMARWSSSTNYIRKVEITTA